MLTLLAVLGVLAIFFVAAVVATREGDVLVDAPPDAADLDLPSGPLQPEDLAALRFGMALRGYRMSEVDDVLDRVQAELAERDARILELEAELSTTTLSGQPAPLAAPSPSVLTPVVTSQVTVPAPVAAEAPVETSAADDDADDDADDAAGPDDLSPAEPEVDPVAEPAAARALDEDWGMPQVQDSGRADADLPDAVDVTELEPVGASDPVREAEPVALEPTSPDDSTVADDDSDDDSDDDVDDDSDGDGHAQDEPPATSPFAAASADPFGGEGPDPLAPQPPLPGPPVPEPLAPEPLVPPAPLPLPDPLHDPDQVTSPAPLGDDGHTLTESLDSPGAAPGERPAAPPYGS